MKEAIESRLRINLSKFVKTPLVRAALLAPVVFAACAQAEEGCEGIETFPPPKDGTVVEKRYEEGNRGGPMDGYPLWDDPDFKVILERCRDEGEDRECSRETFFTSEEIYDGLEVGDYVDFEGMDGVSTQDPMGIKL